MAKSNKPQLTHAKFTNSKIDKMNIKKVNANIAKFKRAVGRRKSAAFNAIQSGNANMQKGYDILEEAMNRADTLIKRHEKTAALKVLSKAYFNPYTTQKTLPKAFNEKLRRNKKFLRQIGVNVRNYSDDKINQLAESAAAVIDHGYYTYHDIVNASNNVGQMISFLNKHSNEDGEELIESFVEEFGLEEML